MYPVLIKSKIKLTIGMLVSNHIQYIRKCMESIKPLLDAVPSELVVLDTMGEGTDGSIDIVREYTNKVYRFEWCNDFSAARNACLDHAQGEWFLYVDDDEWFDDVTEFIEFFNSEECNNYYSGYYYTRDYLSNGSYSIGIAGRMIRRMENTRFVGRVHESFNEVFSPNKQFSCFTHHYGYAHETEEAKAQKQYRNINILEAEIREEGINPKRAAQLVQELLVREETKKAGYERCMEFIARMEQAGKIKESCSQWMLVASVRSFAENGQYAEQLKQAEIIRKRYPLSETAELVLAATLIRGAAEEYDYVTIEKEVDVYLEMWDWRQEHPDEALLQTQMDFPGFFTEADYYRKVYLAAMVANRNEEYEKANQYWKRIPWKQEGFDTSEYQEELARTVQGLKQLQEKKKEELRVVEEKRMEEKKQEIKLLLKTLLEASAYTKASVLQGRYEELSELLFGMQELAITIGQGIDEHIGEGTKAVFALENFCESVWQCSQAEEVETLLAFLEKGAYFIQQIEEQGF